MEVNANNVSNVTVTPVSECKCESDPILDQLSDEPITENSEEVKKAKGFLKGVQKYLKSDKFVQDCNKKSMETGYSPKHIAKTYIAKVGGIIGDTLGIAVDTINLGAVGLIDLIATVLTKAINLILNVVRGLVRIISFNQTNKVEVIC